MGEVRSPHPEERQLKKMSECNCGRNEHIFMVCPVHETVLLEANATIARLNEENAMLQKLNADLEQECERRNVTFRALGVAAGVPESEPAQKMGDALLDRLFRSEWALRVIADIPNKAEGADWEEIEEAREVARKALDFLK